MAMAAHFRWQAIGCLLGLLLSQSKVVASGVVPPRPSPFRQVDLQLTVALDYTEGRLSGRARIELENWSSTSASTASFMLNRLMSVSAARGANAKSLRYRQEIVTFTDDPIRQVRQVLVALPRAVAPGQRAVVELAYSGYLVGSTETGSLYIQDRIDSAFTILREDALAFPVVGVPSWQDAKSIPRVGFTYAVSVTAPVGLTVASAGHLVERRPVGGGVEWRYRGERSVPFLNITVAPYLLMETEGVRLFHFPADSSDAARLLGHTERALTRLREWFGPLRDPPVVTIMEIPDGWGSQASLTGGIIQTAAAFHDTAHFGEIYHELSHLWNAPDLDRPSPRWNEGLASFLALRMARDLDGWTGLDSAIQASAAPLAARLRESQSASTPMLDYGRTGNTDLSYRVGRLLFYLLERLVGPEEFNGIVGGYYQHFAETGGTTEDFASFATSHSAHDLRPLFEDWLRTTNWIGLLDREKTLDRIAELYRRARSP